MKMTIVSRLAAVGALALAFSGGARAADGPFDKVVREVNQKSVKLFGSGGFRGLSSYGSGILISPDGYILTAATQMLDTQDLRVHLYDGRRMHAKVLVVEPELDAALVKITTDPKDPPLDLPYFNLAEAAKLPPSQPGDWVLAFSNQFEIASRDEPVSVQRGVVSAIAKLSGRRGIFEAPYHGDVLYLDAITNNPGSAGGALTNRKGELVGMIGKEFRNTLSDTWVNYATPITAKLEIKEDEKPRVISMLEFADKGMKGEWKATVRVKPKGGPGAYHGIIFVPDIVERTPPYVEYVEPGSPAAKAGLRPDDLLVYADGEPIYSIRAFKGMVKQSKPGLKITLEIRRGEKLTTVELTLADFPKK